jgi:hypothetical protein
VWNFAVLCGLLQLLRSFQLLLLVLLPLLGVDHAHL